MQHPEYFDTVFSEAEKLVVTDPGRVPGFIDSAYLAYPSTPGPLDVYRKYMFLSGFVTDSYRDFDVGLKYTDSALAGLQQWRQDGRLLKDYARGMLRRGYMFMELRRFTDAYNTYNVARQMIEETGDTCSLSEYSFMLASVCNMQRQYLEAARHAKKGIGELAACEKSYGNYKMMANRLDDIGIYYSRSNMPDSALYYFNASLSYMRDHADEHRAFPKSAQYTELLTGVVYGNMGTAYARKRDSATAEKLFLESLRIITQKKHHHGDALFTWAKLAMMYLAQERIAEAGAMLDDMRATLDTLPDLYNEVSWHRRKFDYLRKAGRQQEAYRYIDRYIVLQDSLNKQEVLPAIDVNREYEALRDSYDLMMLEKRAQVKNLYLAIVIGLCVAIGVMAGFWWMHWRRVKKLHQYASSQNDNLQKALNALEESQENNTRMMKIAAHDLRSPIGGMTSAASLMLGEPDRSDDDRMMLGLIKTSGENAMELVNDLLQVQARGEKLEKEPVDMAQMLVYCVELLRHKTTEKQQKIELHAAPLTLSVNREKIWRVVSNLISNAIKFSPSGAHITVQLQQSERGGLIMVKDQGIGIPADIRDEVFDMFTSAKRAGTAGEQPFGLGLAISKQIIEAHGGSIWFDTANGRGTTFFVELPASA